MFSWHELLRIDELIEQPRSCMIVSCGRWEANLHVGQHGHMSERDAFGGQQSTRRLRHALSRIHVRNAVHEGAADAVGPLVHGHRVPTLLSCAPRAKPGGPLPIIATAFA